MNQNEFITAWKEILPGLKSYAMKLCSYKKEDAEDLVQETYIKAQLALETYNKNFSKKTWLYAIAQNKFLDDVRKKKIRSNINKPLLMFESEDGNLTTSKEALTENNGISSIMIEEFQKAISRLDEKERIPFQLYVDGYLYTEISEKCCQPLGTIKVRISNAKRKLWQALKEYEDILTEKNKFNRKK